MREFYAVFFRSDGKYEYERIGSLDEARDNSSIIAVVFSQEDAATIVDFYSKPIL